MTTARHKLNAAYIHGALLIAALLTAVTESWTVFILSASVLTATSILSGEIRLKSRPRRK
ncbi:hypothetical protein GC176_24515 [bacterium]|nr:hypothetical protein [bacterium]